jgi:hemin uptake protein HemP
VVEVWQSSLWIESDLNLFDFSGFDGDLLVRHDGDIALLKASLISRLELESYWLLGSVDQRHGSGDVASNRNDAEINEALIGVLKLQLKWNTFTLNNNINLIKVVKVESNLLLVGLHLSGCEHDGNLNLVFILLVFR